MLIERERERKKKKTLDYGSRLNKQEYYIFHDSLAAALNESGNASECKDADSKNMNNGRRPGFFIYLYIIYVFIYEFVFY